MAITGKRSIASNRGTRPGREHNSNPFLELISSLEAAPLSDRQPLVEQFAAQHGSPFPFVHGEQATFVVRRPGARAVSMVGDLTCWQRGNLPLSHVAGTDLWYLNQRLPQDARVDYKYIVDGDWLLDPFNPRSIKSGFGENSELAMPGWRPSPAVAYRADVPHGRVVRHKGFHSATLGNARDIAIYLPADHNPAGSYPSLYVHDGLEYIDLASMTTVLDNLIAGGRIEPLVVVFVPPVDRGPEYGGPRMLAFEEFIVRELVPFVDERYGTATVNPQRRGMMGASMGGHISLRMGYDYPEHFGRLGGQSSALWAYDGQLLNKYRARRPEGQRIYLSTGNVCDNTRINDSFSAMLKTRGYTQQYRVYNEGHSWGFWRNDLEALLTFLWPA